LPHLKHLRIIRLHLFGLSNDGNTDPLREANIKQMQERLRAKRIALVIED
jgi:hypothetical protein